MLQFGYSKGQVAELIEKRMQTHEDDVFLVDESNKEALETFIACSGQWRFHPKGYPLSLDYNAVRGFIKDYFEKDQRRKIFTGVRLIERGALRGMSKKDG